MPDALLTMRWTLRALQLFAIIANIVVAAIATAQVQWYPVERCYQNPDGSTSCYVSHTHYVAFQSGGMGALPFCGIGLVGLVATCLVGRSSAFKAGVGDALLTLLWCIGGLVALLYVRRQTTWAFATAMVSLAWALAGLFLLAAILDSLLNHRANREALPDTERPAQAAGPASEPGPDSGSSGFHLHPATEEVKQ